jgi:hypothetical protein
VFITIGHFNPSLIFAGNAGEIRCSTWVGLQILD